MPIDNPTFTVFTPTYNRENTLHRVYDSLCEQTFTDFEWLIVDDGSTDQTARLVSTWRDIAPFSIRYFYQDNKGKHVAFNKGVSLAKGELFLPADSDDAFIPTALEIFYKAWCSIPQNNKQPFSAVTANCIDCTGKLIGTPFPKTPLDSDPEEIFFHHKVKGEKWGFHRTAVLKEFPFPEPAHLKFVSESYVWFRIARHYKTRFINENLRIYYQDTDNQLTKRSPFKTAEARIFYADTLNHCAKWFLHTPWIFFRTAAIYVRFCILAKDSLLTLLSRIHGLPMKFFVLFSYPAGALLAIKDIYYAT